MSWVEGLTEITERESYIYETVCRKLICLFSAELGENIFGNIQIWGLVCLKYVAWICVCKFTCSGLEEMLVVPYLFPQDNLP